MNFEVKIESAGFAGVAMLDFPTRSEKMKILNEIRALGYGSEDLSDESTLSDKKMALASRMGDIVDQRLVSLDVKFVETGLQITDKCMLDIYSECQALVGVIANYLLGGVSLGKEKS